jgi:hypothetical protein
MTVLTELKIKKLHEFRTGLLDLRKHSLASRGTRLVNRKAVRFPRANPQSSRGSH